MRSVTLSAEETEAFYHCTTAGHRSNSCPYPLRQMCPHLDAYTQALDRIRMADYAVDEAGRVLKNRAMGMAPVAPPVAHCYCCKRPEVAGSIGGRNWCGRLPCRVTLSKIVLAETFKRLRAVP